MVAPPRSQASHRHRDRTQIPEEPRNYGTQDSSLNLLRVDLTAIAKRKCSRRPRCKTVASCREVAVSKAAHSPAQRARLLLSPASLPNRERLGTRLLDRLWLCSRRTATSPAPLRRVLSLTNAVQSWNCIFHSLPAARRDSSELSRLVPVVGWCSAPCTFFACPTQKKIPANGDPIAFRKQDAAFMPWPLRPSGTSTTSLDEIAPDYYRTQFCKPLDLMTHRASSP